MKRLSRSLLGIIVFFLAVVVLLYIFNFEYILRALQVTYFNGYTTAYITDHSEFANREIEAGEPQPWPQHSNYNKAETTPDLEKINEELGTVAFLIIKNDSIWYENYSEDFGKDSRTNSFSMAKSIVSALLGKAIRDGKIKSLDQPVADFFPQFDKRLTVGDLSSMSSGLNWDESYYNPFSMTARAYFGEDIREQILDLEVTEEPGKEFKYLSGNTELLAMVIEKATGITVSEYLSESFWKPLGMQQDALWQLDSEESGMEKAYCCIASNARDFARLGKLYKHFGTWNGNQLLDSSFVATSIQPRFEDSPHYGYGLWLENYRDKEIFYMRGILGQYVIVIPEDDLIIVRLGEEKYPKKEDQEHSDDFYVYIDEAYKMLGETK
ncbi:serine hydrolase domain-containing protein [Salinimicrobium gaetbulicola]|uniref:Serine hydrolase domain-containing protein n=1 Tax=Salinimicrobium gaetbulicola TaxID=999702 RepID=A0ABW3IGD2_9FLAO